MYNLPLIAFLKIILKPFSYVGYYRDYQINKGNYLNLNEAVLHVFDGGFGSIDSIDTDTRIYKYHNNQTFPNDTLANMPYDFDNERKYVSSTELGNPKAGRNEYNFLRIHNAIRNYNINSYDFVNRLDMDFINNHKFKFLPLTSVDSIKLYSISIYKRFGNYFSATGKIFISKEDYKIYKMQYAVYDRSLSMASRKKQQTNFKRSDIKKKKLGKLLYEIILEYQLYQDRMFPKYISFNNSFQSLNPPVIYPEKVELNDFELFIPGEEGPDEIKLTFSLDSSQKKAVKKGKYRLWYNNKILNFKKEIDESDIVEFYQLKKNLVEVAPYKDTEKLDQKNTIREYKKIYDNYRYELYIGPYRGLNQYREFFVQELDMDIAKPTDTLYMVKNQPIFKNQPIAPRENLSEYWMNTPLKN